jgi:hypothetical protein
LDKEIEGDDEWRGPGIEPPPREEVADNSLIESQNTEPADKSLIQNQTIEDNESMMQIQQDRK